jgi:hypothetical protein
MVPRSVWTFSIENIPWEFHGGAANQSSRYEAGQETKTLEGELGDGVMIIEQ